METDQRADYSGRRMELSIKECPSDIAMRFIEFARTRWHGKQWVALKALLDSVETEENWKLTFDRLQYLQGMVEKHEIILSKVNVKIEAAAPEEEKKEPPKMPKTFGGAKKQAEGEHAQL